MSATKPALVRVQYEVNGEAHQVQAVVTPEDLAHAPERSQLTVVRNVPGLGAQVTVIPWHRVIMVTFIDERKETAGQ